MKDIITNHIFVMVKDFCQENAPSPNLIIGRAIIWGILIPMKKSLSAGPHLDLLLQHMVYEIFFFLLLVYCTTAVGPMLCITASVGVGSLELLVMSVELMPLWGCVPSLQMQVDLAWHFPFPRLLLLLPFPFLPFMWFFLWCVGLLTSIGMGGGGCEVTDWG